LRSLGQNAPSEWSGDWRILRSLAPYLLEFPARVGVALAFLVLAKLANVAVPVALKYIVDDLDAGKTQVLAVPLALVLAYGGLRFATILFGELRDAVFGRVAERAMRRVGLQVFRHLHTLELDFHLARRTGGLSRDIERGTAGISFLLRFMIFNIVPTLFEIAMVAAILLLAYDPLFAVITCASVAIYVLFSVLVTEWRTRYVREANEMDSLSNTRAVDSLLNFETVKYFANEGYEAQEYDRHLERWEQARLKNRLSLAALNAGQGLIISAAITLMMLLAAWHVSRGNMSLGDLVLVNAYMIQLFIPLNFLGFVYREIKQSLANIERMFGLLERSPQVLDRPDAKPLQAAGGSIRFEHVSFSYRPDRPILRDLSFEIPAGQKVAVVGPSGAGKSTVARLLFRFYDVDAGRITVDGQDLREVTQDSLRRVIGVVPQDTVLFNDTIRYNIAYGRPDAGEAEVARAARLAHLDGFLARLPEGLNTLVGERGLKVSGGEKQRIAIARTLLKDPVILVFDEATSSLDSSSERAILQAMREVARERTTLAIAHRLSTVVDADRIIVLEDGQVVESGSHAELLARAGVYAELWRHQQREQAREVPEPLASAHLP